MFEVIDENKTESDIDQATRQVGAYARIMREENDACDARINARELSRILQYIETAYLENCKAMIDALAERVVTLCGDASSLEDAAFKLEKEIQAEINAKELHPARCRCERCESERAEYIRQRRKDKEYD